MKPAETTLGRMAEKVGTMTFLAWTFVIGLGGFLLMCGVAYAIVTENLALGIACGALLIAPTVLALVWFLMAGADWVVESRAREEEFRKADLVSEPDAQQPLLAPGKSVSRD